MVAVRTTPHCTSMPQLVIQAIDLSILLLYLTCRRLKNFVQLCAELLKADRQTRGKKDCIIPSKLKKVLKIMQLWIWCKAEDSQTQVTFKLRQHRQCTLYRISACQLCGN